MKALLGATALIAAAVGVAITLTPSSHDFGKAAVGGGRAMMTFQVALPTGAGPGDTVVATIAGRDPGDFLIQAPHGSRLVDDCFVSWRQGSCFYHVDFAPHSTGVKQASLVVTDSRGSRVTAPLKGEGVDAMCEMKVVFCNYAHLYSGVFSWTSNLASAGSSHHEQVQVDVIHGVATCNGGATESGNGQSRSAPITGSGLVAVEFEKDSANNLVYRVTVACPTPAWPALNNDPAMPSRPAEMGHNDQGSYNQPATGIGMTVLKGSYSNPSPDTDPLNGVTGTVSVSWNLIHK